MIGLIIGLLLASIVMFFSQSLNFTRQYKVDSVDQAKILIEEEYNDSWSKVRYELEGFHIETKGSEYYCFLKEREKGKHGYYLYYRAQSKSKAMDICTIRIAMTGPF